MVIASYTDRLKDRYTLELIDGVYYVYCDETNSTVVMGGGRILCGASDDKAHMRSYFDGLCSADDY